MFDNASRTDAPTAPRPRDRKAGPEEERIALRCSRKELQLLDSFVANGEFESRSELMRQALRDFLRARALPAVTPPAAADPTGLLEVPVRLRREEVETLSAYARLTGNGHPLADVLATLVRRGELELKVAELVQRSRASLREAADARTSLEDLTRSAQDLERRGVVGR